MKKTIILFGLIIVLFLLIACAPVSVEESPVLEQEEIITEPVEEPVEESVVPVVQSPSDTVVIEEKELSDNQDSDEVSILLDKSKTITNYRYKVYSAVRNQYDQMIQDPVMEITIKDNKVKVTYTSPEKEGNNLFYSEIYLSGNQSYGTCQKTTVLCKEFKEKYFSVDYSFEDLGELLLDYVEKVPSSADIVNSEVVKGRKADVLEYVNEVGNKEELSIDLYSGLPVKRIVYKTVDGEDLIQETSTFDLIYFKGIKDSDVSLPSGYEELET